MSQLVFFLEELSAMEMLKNLLPRLLPDNIQPIFVVFEGKQDLEGQLPIKLRGWKKPCLGFIVLRDKDGGDCLVTKKRIEKICADAGKKDVLIRIACHELESWYLGDLKAVDIALNTKNLAALQGKAKFRTPDDLANAAEELSKITEEKYKKVSGSREIGKHINIDPRQNCSHSYGVFISGVLKVASVTI